MGMTEKIRRAVRLQSLERRYILCAMKELALARLRHAVLPTGRIVQLLREAPPIKPAAADAAAIDVAHLSWAINAAAARVPWRADCLLRAMAADRWLRRCGERPQFFLGVANDDDNFIAHAWLRCRGLTVTGGDGADYTPIIAPTGPLVRAKRDDKS